MESVSILKLSLDECFLNCEPVSDERKDFYIEKSNLLKTALITYIYFCLLRSKVPLETCMHICIKGDFSDAILNRYHVSSLVWCMTCYCRSSKSSSLGKDNKVQYNMLNNNTVVLGADDLFIGWNKNLKTI